jgi:hypothetical protein
LTLDLFERHIYYNTITQNDEGGTRSTFIKVPTSAAAGDTRSGATAISTSAASTTTYSPINSVLFVTAAILDYAKVSPLVTTYKGHDAHFNGASFYQNNLLSSKCCNTNSIVSPGNRQ